MDAPSTTHTRRGVLATGATALAAGVVGCVGFAGPDVTSGNGDVEAGVGPDLGAEVLATVGNGDLDVEVELDRASVSARQARGRLGDGGPLLTLTSGNGDVRLYEIQG